MFEHGLVSKVRLSGWLLRNWHPEIHYFAVEPEREVFVELPGQKLKGEKLKHQLNDQATKRLSFVVA